MAKQNLFCCGRRIYLDQIINPNPEFEPPPAPSETQLYLQFDTGFPAAITDPNDVSLWNTYLKFVDTSNTPGSFTSCQADPFSFDVFLINWSLADIKITSTSGLNGDLTLSLIDDTITGLIKTATADAFNTTTRLYSFSSSSLVSFGNRAFARTNLQTLYTPLCTQLGSTSGDDQVFDNLGIGPGGPLDITVAQNLETNDGGSPDGDIQYAAANYNLTVTYIP